MHLVIAFLLVLILLDLALELVLKPIENIDELLCALLDVIRRHSDRVTS